MLVAVGPVPGVELGELAYPARGSRTWSGSGCRPACRTASRPALAAPGTIMREPKTAAASPLRKGATISRQALRGVLAVPVQQDDDVQSVIDGQPVRRLLVAAVPEVLGVPDDVGPDGLALAPQPPACSKVSSWLASSEMMISATVRAGPPAGIRSRVAASVDAALYATTTMPILGSTASLSVIGSLSSTRSSSWLWNDRRPRPLAPAPPRGGQNAIALPTRPMVARSHHPVKSLTATGPGLPDHEHPRQPLDSGQWMTPPSRNAGAGPCDSGPGSATRWSGPWSSCIPWSGCSR